MTAVETQSVRRELCQFGSMNIKDRSVSHDVCGSQTKPAGFTASLVGLRTAVRVMQGAVSVPSSQTNPRPRGEVGSKPTCRNEMSVRRTACWSLPFFKASTLPSSPRQLHGYMYKQANCLVMNTTRRLEWSDCGLWYCRASRAPRRSSRQGDGMLERWLACRAAGRQGDAPWLPAQTHARWDGFVYGSVESLRYSVLVAESSDGRQLAWTEVIYPPQRLWSTGCLVATCETCHRRPSREQQILVLMCPRYRS